MQLKTHNTLRILGSEEEVKAVRDYMKIEWGYEDEYAIDFNNIIPVPYEILNTIYPRIYQDRSDLFKIYDKYKFRDYNYSESKCYKWSKENWGSKWNADCESSENNTKDTIQFITYPNAVMKVILKISEKFPERILVYTYKSDINIEYYNAFMYIVQNGEDYLVWEDYTCKK